MTKSFASSRLLLDAGISMLVSLSWVRYSPGAKRRLRNWGPRAVDSISPVLARPASRGQRREPDL